MKAKSKTADEYAKILTEASEHYYNETQIMDDPEWDDLRDEFFALYPDHSFFAAVGTTKLNPQFTKVTHEIPMGSLQKIKTEEELVSWNETTDTKVSGQQFNFLVSLKQDGLSLEVKYKDGKLVRMVTRGDGLVGEDITNNGFLMNIPKKLKEPVTLTVRGEGMLKKSVFEKYFTDKANPRNAVSGLLRRLDGERCEHADFIAYDIIGENFSTKEEKFARLKKLGFTCSPNWFCQDLGDVQKIWNQYQEGSRDEFEYEIDGLVVEVNQIALQELLGERDLRPYWARAYKFKPVFAETTVEDVNWQVGRTGRITPVAKLTPVKLMGTTITNVTLNNLSDIRKLGLVIGATVKIKRAGDVIPKVVEVVSRGEDKKIIPPTTCPSCGSPTTEEEIFLLCKNHDNCPAQAVSMLNHWIKCLDVRGIGDELVTRLNDSGLVKHPADFYRLTKEQLLTMERMGVKLADKLLLALHAIKELTLSEFVKALGIPNVSAKTVEAVIHLYPTLDQLKNADTVKMSEVHGIGTITAEQVVVGLKAKEEVIADLLKFITIKETKIVVGGQLDGQSFCFTGVRSKEAEAKIKELGGSVASGVSKNLTYLVAKDPEENSAKLKKARESGCKIISLAECLSLVGL